MIYLEKGKIEISGNAVDIGGEVCSLLSTLERSYKKGEFPFDILKIYDEFKDKVESAEIDKDTGFTGLKRAKDFKGE